MPNGDGRNDGLTEVIYAMDPQYRDLCAEFGVRIRLARRDLAARAAVHRFKIPVTFFACAVALERNRRSAPGSRRPATSPAVMAGAGRKSGCSRARRSRSISARAIDSIKETCGDRPPGWYCRYGPSVNTRELLVEEGGFVYDSDAYNDDLPYYVDVKGKRHLIIPYSMTYNDGKFGLLPSYGSPADFLDNLKRGLDQLWDEGDTHPRMMSIGLHPRLIGQASRIHALREFIEYAQKKGEVWFTRRIDIANWWNEHHGTFAP